MGIVYQRGKKVASFPLILFLILPVVGGYVIGIITMGPLVPFVVVEGSSMLPTLYNGDIVIIYKPEPQDIHVGDIIVYRSLRGNLVIHRVIKIVEAPGCNPVCYVTKGDNNYHPDNMLGLQPLNGISYDEVLGVVLSLKLTIEGKKVKAPVRIPYLGLLTLYIRG